MKVLRALPVPKPGTAHYKRAFNLIELAVVFLLIGLISAMVYKGKELLDTASVRAEVNKLSKLRNAIATVMTMTSKGDLDELDYLPATGYDTKPLFDLELISKEDIAVQGSSENWAIFPCINVAAGFKFDVDTGSGSMICALHKTYPIDLVCNTEVMSDNQDLDTGLGGAFERDGTKPGNPIDNISPGMKDGEFDCDALATKAPQVYGFILYR
jgi:hypothetical protein